MLLILLLDAAVLVFLVAAVNENEQVEWWKAAVVAFLISLLAGFSLKFLVEQLELMGLLIGLVPVAVVAGLVSWVAFGLTLQRAMILGACFVGWKLVQGLSLAFLSAA